MSDTKLFLYSVAFALGGAALLLAFWRTLRTRLVEAVKERFRSRSTGVKRTSQPGSAGIELKNVCGDLIQWLLGATVIRLLGYYHGFRSFRAEYQNAVETGPPIRMYGSSPSVKLERMYPPPLLPKISIEDVCAVCGGFGTVTTAQGEVTTLLFHDPKGLLCLRCAKKETKG